MTHAERTVTPPSQERWVRDSGAVQGDPSHPALSRLRNRLERSSVPPFEVEVEDGTVYRLAGGARPSTDDDEPRFRLVARAAPGLRALASLDELQIATGYMQADLDVEGDFLAALDLREVLTDRHPIRSLVRFVIPLLIGQRRSDAAWVPRHYDFGNEFYFAFLDKQYRMYSQALYTSEDESLEQAVVNKLEYILDACRLGPGSYVLDVGAGWGSLERFTAPRGVHTTMLTLSSEQYKWLSQLCVTHRWPARLRVVRESIFAYQAPESYDAIVLL